ncbi:DUF2809 domain-containing protein [Paenibacillus sp. MMS20-IR301]|uniref:ribosomal maturation YjgA family protein n=1 Tax=Paenibacillus sp. MMS20-IR301 TaxID=2895946 RepID=UPI0028F01380|nr:DUF2809 domain-containing protein [Paenibacillus sp. MMS20-IR301]WNS45928.1 DUF2809 domain-containing protein [Paenibacillus sp. MMS20-IR301]
MRASVIKLKLLYCGAIIIPVILGLATRAYGERLPQFVSSHFGDALWAGMIYFGFRALLTSQPKRISLVLGLCFCFGIEFSQLYQTEWITGIRATTLGSLILGRGFLWIDLVRYTAGILFCYMLDRLLQK